MINLTHCSEDSKLPFSLLLVKFQSCLCYITYTNSPPLARGLRLENKLLENMLISSGGLLNACNISTRMKQVSSDFSMHVMNDRTSHITSLLS